MKFIILISFFLSIKVYAQLNSDALIVEKYIPKEILSAIDPDSNPPRSLQKDQVIQKFYTDQFGSKDGSRYIIATYSNSGVVEDNPISRTIIIKVSKDGKTEILPSPATNKNYNIFENSKVYLIDLDNDKINEVVVVNYSLKGYDSDSKIFKWIKTGLIDISPAGQNGKPGIISQLDLDALPLIVYSQIIESKSGGPDIYTQKIAHLSSGSIIDLGAFDFIKVISKTARKVVESTYQLGNLEEGSYALEVKNLSNHTWSVRAEISINNIVVLKPTDFCKGKPKPFIKQKNINGNHIDEDDDDDDEDQCKRCDPKASVGATVNLKKENNVIRVKLYGNKNSKVQVTLKRKAHAI